MTKKLVRLINLQVNKELNLVDSSEGDLIDYTKMTKELPRMSADKILMYKEKILKDVLKYTLVKYDVLLMAIDIVNQLVNKVKSGECSDELVNEAFDSVGYYNARWTRLVISYTIALDRLYKNRGSYDLGTLTAMDLENGNTNLVDNRNNITFISKEAMGNLFGRDTICGYQTIIAGLTELGLANRLDYYRIPPRQQDKDGKWKAIGRGVAKAIVLSDQLVSKMNKAVKSKVVAVESSYHYSGLYNKLIKEDYEYLTAILGLLNINVTEELYNAALERLKFGCYQRNEETGEFDDRSSKVTVKIFNPITKKWGYEEMSWVAALDIVAIYERDFVRLLTYTIDDYGRRLHTIATRFPKVFKKFLRHGVNHIASVDVTSCQPYIFMWMLCKSGFPEFPKAIYDVMKKYNTDDFYTACTILLGLPKEQVDAMLKRGAVLTEFDDDIATEKWITKEAIKKVIGNCSVNYNITTGAELDNLDSIAFFNQLDDYTDPIESLRPILKENQLQAIEQSKAAMRSDVLDKAKSIRKGTKLTFMSTVYGVGKPHQLFMQLICEKVYRDKKYGVQRAKEFEDFMKSLLATEYKTEFKEGSYEKIARYVSRLPEIMQRKETEIMFGEDGVINKLLDEAEEKNLLHTFTTVHDSVMCDEEDIEIVENVVRETFQEKLFGEFPEIGLEVGVKSEIY